MFARVRLGRRRLVDRADQGGLECIDLGAQHRAPSVDRRTHSVPLLAELLEQRLDMFQWIGRPRSAAS